VRVASGKINGISGESWTKEMRAGDHVVAPPQPWLDGFAQEKGKIRQFVAMQMGMGLTVEAQISGKEEFGGLQLEVIPMKGDEYNRRFPERTPIKVFDPCRDRRSTVPQSGSKPRHFKSATRGATLSCNTSDLKGSLSEESIGAVAPDMGLGAGGLIEQQIFQDTYPEEVWDTLHTSRVFVHLANSFAWEAITGKAPPTTPCDAATYARRNMPWYDHYLAKPVQAGGEKLQNIRTILELGFQRGLHVFPSNPTIDPHNVIHYGDKRPDVRDGTW
jgi:hypothetical protein